MESSLVKSPSAYLMSAKKKKHTERERERG